jgi:hypothetical protein
MMIFVDSENLVCRYQEMIKNHIPRKDGVIHMPDILIWHPTFVFGIGLDEVLRTTYYTSVIGDESKQQEIINKIKSLTFTTHQNSRIPNTLTPKVFKKIKGRKFSKGVDIQLSVDVLNQVHSNNLWC